MSWDWKRSSDAASGSSPQSLSEALEELKKDPVIQGALGVIADEFIGLKEAEYREYHSQVTQWEVDRYLTMF